MKIEPLSVTYARALIELGAQAGRLDAVLEDVRLLAGLLRSEREFRAFLESPSIATRTKQEALDRVFKGKLDDLVLNFLELVLLKKRQFLLTEIFAECEILYDQTVGRVHVEATSAVPLSDERKDGLASILKDKLGRKVVLENHVRPEIVGGLILRYGDLVADSSVQTALSRIAERMMQNKPGSELVHENQS